MTTRTDNLSPHDAQRLLLETVLRMVPLDEFKGYTHLRYTTDAGWYLLDADDNEMRSEKRIKMGDLATELAARSLLPFEESSHSRCTICFKPARMQIDVFNSDNSTTHSEIIIDVDLEGRVRREISTNLGG